MLLGDGRGEQGGEPPGSRQHTVGREAQENNWGRVKC